MNGMLKSSTARLLPAYSALASLLVLNACSGQSATVPQFSSGFANALKAPPPHRIYVANTNANDVTTYTPAGAQTKPTITAGIDIPYGIAVDAGGKIYVANAGNNTITTYTAGGGQTTPTIHVKERTRDLGVQDVAVDKNGSIYVLNSSDGQGGDVAIYNADGSPAASFTVATSTSPIALAVDANGKIYVSLYFINNNGPGRVLTFLPNGKRTTPTITAQMPWGVAVDSQGKIYVAAGPGIVTFTPDGRPTKPRIDDHDQFGNGLAYGITVDSRGYVYAANCAVSPCTSVTTYKPDGSQTSPTITQGLNAPIGVAVH